MAKYPEIADTLKRQIARGDFTISGVPSERRLAELLNVSRMTARRAICELLDEGTLAKTDTGRVTINKKHSDNQNLLIAFLAPSSNSFFVQDLRVRAERMAPEYGLHVRSINYVDWEDPVFNDTLANFHGVFLYGIGNYPTDIVLKKLEDCGKPVVSVESDLSEYGIPSIMIYPDKCVYHILDYLRKTGHREIYCFNTLPMSKEVRKRIEQWEKFLKKHKIKGELISEEAGKAPDTLSESYELMNRFIKDKRTIPPAIFSTGGISAIGAMRAAYDNGYEAGKDYSICSLGGDGLYRYVTPSITALESPKPETYFSQCFEWFLRNGEKWGGSFLLSPKKFPIFEGESSCKAL